jgi:hypothetical protein
METAQARNFASVVPSPSACEHSALMIGKRIPLSAGTVQLRVAVPSTVFGPAGTVVKVPTRYHTGPDCPTAQSFPVGSRSGLWRFGIENTYCHHTADHSPYVSPNGVEFGGKTSELGSKPWATVIVVGIIRLKTTPTTTMVRRQHLVPTFIIVPSAEAAIADPSINKLA